jgi:hypothetical protein
MGIEYAQEGMQAEVKYISTYAVEKEREEPTYLSNPNCLRVGCLLLLP